MNPYPFAPLNHFTVPFSLTEKLLSLIVKNCSPVPGLRPGRPGPPSEKPVEPGCVYAVRGNYFQKGKDPSVPFRSGYPLRETLESGNLVRFHHTQLTSTTCSALITGLFSGNEQKIISSIKTFRKIN